MSDRDLLEAAARAAGIELTCGYAQAADQKLAFYRAPSGHLIPWAPLTDDGDALRLAVGRRFSVRIFSASDGEIPTPGFVEVWREDDDDPLHVEYVESGDYTAATRRAIVRAAAALTQPEGGA